MSENIKDFLTGSTFENRAEKSVKTSKKKKTYVICV